MLRCESNKSFLNRTCTHTTRSQHTITTRMPNWSSIHIHIHTRHTSRVHLTVHIVCSDGVCVVLCCVLVSLCANGDYNLSWKAYQHPMPCHTVYQATSHTYNYCIAQYVHHHMGLSVVLQNKVWSYNILHVHFFSWSHVIHF